MRPAPFRRCSDGLLLDVRLTPKSSRNDIDGTKELDNKVYVQARVRAVPEGNRANAALIELFAAKLSLPKSTISLASGHTARLKTLHIAGDPQALETSLAALLERIA